MEEAGSHVIEIVGATITLLVVIGAMLASRAVVVFGLVPGIGRLPEYDHIGRGHQMVMFWGGLRGALALAVALSLPNFGRQVAGFGDLNQVIVALVMGAVLFSLLAQGLTIESLVRKFQVACTSPVRPIGPHRRTALRQAEDVGTDSRVGDRGTLLAPNLEGATYPM